MNRANCACKYCTKRPQKEISHGLGLKTRPSASSSPAPVHRTRKPPPPKPPHASLRKPPPKIDQKTYPGPRQALCAEKDSDVRDSLTRREVQGLRYFRPGELVWCALSSPIFAPGTHEDGVEFWPGIVEMMATKAKAVPLPDSNEIEQSASHVQDEDDHRSRTHTPKPQINWKPVQSHIYRVRLLATAHILPFTDDDLLPYLAYAPSDTLVQKLQQYLPEALRDQDPALLADDIAEQFDFNPVAGVEAGLASIGRFKQCVVPCALAIQIASHIAGFWTPTDEWDFKLTINVPAASPAATDPVQSLQDLTNAEVSDSATSKDASPLTVPRTVTQLRYQGLWWGAERIWTEELVRLKLARCQFAPTGNEIVYPPAGPSKSTREWNAQHGVALDDSLAGSGEKGLFMKIDGLFVVEIDNKDGPGVVKECRASGMIYELVDQDWEESDGNVPAHTSDTNGKGKGRATDVGSPATLLQNDGAGSSHNGSPSAQTTSPSAPQRPVLTATYPLPDPPMGYKFKPILQPGHEVVLSLSLISGRYYPHLFEHPRLLQFLKKVVQENEGVDESGITQHKHIWAMQGILPGIHQSMDPVTWKPTRWEMFVEADKIARQQFRTTRAQLIGQAGGDVAMGDALDDPFAFIPGPSQSISAAGSSISAHI